MSVFIQCLLLDEIVCTIAHFIERTIVKRKALIFYDMQSFSLFFLRKYKFREIYMRQGDFFYKKILVFYLNIP